MKCKTSIIQRWDTAPAGTTKALYDWFGENKIREVTRLFSKNITSEQYKKRELKKKPYIHKQTKRAVGSKGGRRRLRWLNKHKSCASLKNPGKGALAILWYQLPLLEHSSVLQCPCTMRTDIQFQMWRLTLPHNLPVKSGGSAPKEPGSSSDHTPQPLTWCESTKRGCHHGNFKPRRPDQKDTICYYRKLIQS